MMRRMLVFNLMLLTVSLTGCSAAIDADNAARFQAAEQSFVAAKSADDYLAVAGQYQQILDTGFRSGTILYNQGNAFLKAGQPGRSIAAYCQAKRFRPGDPLLDSNLRTAMGQTGVAGSSSIIDRLLFWQNWISYGNKFLWTTIFLSVAVVCFMVSQLIAKRLMFKLGIAFAVVATLSMLSTGYDWYRFDVLQHGVIVTDAVIARKGAAESYDEAFTEPLPEGTRFLVTETVSDWIRIQVGSAGQGWIPLNSAVVY